MFPGVFRHFGRFFGPPFRRAAEPCGLYGRVCGAVGLRFMRQPSASLIVSPEGVEGP